jgi:predicted DNA-binding transcriptional regulator AlpA
MTDSPTKPTSSSIPDLAERHGWSVAFVYKMIAQGRGPKTIKIGRTCRITDTDEREWLDSLRAEADGGAK